VLLWNILNQDRIHRVSGLEYLRILLAESELRETGKTLWVMPTEDSMRRNLEWLKLSGYPTEAEDCYLAPKYAAGPIADEALVEQINRRKPRHVIIGLGGGVQEKLGHYLKRNCDGGPSIHCIGAAIGFLTGDQVWIPHWADRCRLGWLFRCAENPRRCMPE
jgi:UDP-N-acetyl-D-mannosaminuronic acid transferase (WecB/TagA/CpsF family)